MRPLPLLGQLAAHEQELLARVGPHPGVQGPQVGELGPAVPGHLVEHRPLAVDDLVVGEGQHEVFVPGIKQAEGQVVLVVAAEERVDLEVLERVVHPAHVPLVAETEAAQVGGPGDAGQEVDSSAIVVAPGYSE